MAHRSNFVRGEVTYGAVGASADPNIAKYPPAGFEGYEDAVLIGMGERKFRDSVDRLFSWEAQRSAGIEVHNLSVNSDSGYSGIVLDSEGLPVHARSAGEVAYSASGEEMIQAGMSATLEWRFRKTQRRVQVVFSVDEPRRAGFALGTLDENGVVGEEFFWIEYRADNTVWASVRGFLAAPEGGWLGLKQRVLVRLAKMSSRAQLLSLVRPRTAL